MNVLELLGGFFGPGLLTRPHPHIHVDPGVCQPLVLSEVGDLRSALHPDGADVVQSTLLDVAALRGELQTLSLEVLLLEHSHLHAHTPTEQSAPIPLTQNEVCVTLKKGAMPIPELTRGCIIGDLVVLYILTPEGEKTHVRVLRLMEGRGVSVLWVFLLLT